VGEKLALEKLYTPTLDVCKFDEVDPQEKTNTECFLQSLYNSTINTHVITTKQGFYSQRWSALV